MAPRDDRPRLTIISATYNVGELLARTAASVRMQTWRNVQWIVVDGASTDDTRAVAEANRDVISTFISEPDRGVYDAWNKALPLIDGDWVLFLGAGDRLSDSGTLDRVAPYLASAPPDATLVFGDVTVTDGQSGVVRVHPGTWSGIDGPWVLGRPYLPLHPGTFHRASLFKGGFSFDTRCRIAADNELMLRELLAGHELRVPLTIVDFDNGGISSNQRNRLRMIAEVIYINWKVGIGLKRPVYQAWMLAANVVRHAMLVAGLLRR
jgi:glycosyltransferase involved in cell wall biosynthesis